MVIVGAGPIGLAAVLTARLFSPSHIVVVDPVAARRDAAKQMGADVAVNPADDVLDAVQVLTAGLGADVVVEAVGVPETFELCTTLVRPGGHVANIGVHGAPPTLHLEDLWIKDVTITTGLVDTRTTRCCWACSRPASRRLRDWSPTGSASTRCRTPTTCSRGPGETGALKVALFGDHARMP